MYYNGIFVLVYGVVFKKKNNIYIYVYEYLVFFVVSVFY